MLNCFSVEGYLSDDVALTFDDNKKIKKASFHLKNPQKNGKKSFINEFYVVVYGKKGEQCAENLKKDKKVTITGKINTWAYRDETGNSQAGVTITASDVYW